MSRSRFMVPVALAITVILPLALGCWGNDKEVTIENRSSEVVVVFWDGVPTMLLQPGVTDKSTIPRFTGTHTYSIESFESREVVTERTFTWDDIEREDGITIVVE